MVARRTVKAVVELVLDASGAAALAGSRMGGRDLVLAYHNIVPDSSVRPGAAASAHLGASDFAAQMRVTAQVADVVPVRELARPPRDPSRPRVAITFDDGYASAIRHAVPVLSELGLPATFFVGGELIGSGGFWWDQPDLDVWARRGDVLERLQGRGPLVREWLRANGMSAPAESEELRAATLEELVQAVQVPGLTIGSHTMRHPNLASLAADEVREELVESRDWLAARFGDSYIPWVAYPYGIANEEVERIAREAGYEGAFVLDGGWIPGAAHSRFALPRLNIAAGLSARGFRLRLANIFAR